MHNLLKQAYFAEIAFFNWQNLPTPKNCCVVIFKVCHNNFYFTPIHMQNLTTGFTKKTRVVSSPCLSMLTQLD
jgi:hypothetical protein